ncbi:hypothetical protein LTR66_000638 [Elasticomyces elasticus]|nr:hypothetical protein LTR28_004909 [Elasticomyces elasticus]KAK5000523.1 hypothetical protein LTR66_000638 [Elasticomyces elasticus]
MKLRTAAQRKTTHRAPTKRAPAALMKTPQVSVTATGTPATAPSAKASGNSRAEKELRRLEINGTPSLGARMMINALEASFESTRSRRLRNVQTALVADDVEEWEDEGEDKDDSTSNNRVNATNTDDVPAIASSVAVPKKLRKGRQQIPPNATDHQMMTLYANDLFEEQLLDVLSRHNNLELLTSINKMQRAYGQKEIDHSTISHRIRKALMDRAISKRTTYSQEKLVWNRLRQRNGVTNANGGKVQTRRKKSDTGGRNADGSESPSQAPPSTKPEPIVQPTLGPVIPVRATLFQQTVECMLSDIAQLNEMKPMSKDDPDHGRKPPPGYGLRSNDAGKVAPYALPTRRAESSLSKSARGYVETRGNQGNRIVRPLSLLPPEPTDDPTSIHNEMHANSLMMRTGMLNTDLQPYDNGFLTAIPGHLRPRKTAGFPSMPPPASRTYSAVPDTNPRVKKRARPSDFDETTTIQGGRETNPPFNPQNTIADAYTNISIPELIVAYPHIARRSEDVKNFMAKNGFNHAEYVTLVENLEQAENLEVGSWYSQMDRYGVVMQGMGGYRTFGALVAIRDWCKARDEEVRNTHPDAHAGNEDDARVLLDVTDGMRQKTGGDKKIANEDVGVEMPDGERPARRAGVRRPRDGGIYMADGERPTRRAGDSRPRPGEIYLEEYNRWFLPDVIESFGSSAEIKKYLK